MSYYLRINIKSYEKRMRFWKSFDCTFLFYHLSATHISFSAPCINT